MKKHLFFLLLCFLIITSKSCKKDDENPSQDRLPDVHNIEELSAFGCKVNGEVWLPSNTIGSYTYTYHEPTGGLIIGAIRKEGAQPTDRWEQIGLGVNFFDVGEYPLRNLSSYTDTDFCLDYPEYLLDTLASHFIRIESFSTQDGVIIGTFEFSAINDDCSNQIDTVRITDGRFKITYK